MRKLLILAANPPDTSQLAHGEELRAIKREIQAGPDKDAFELIVNEATRFRDLVAMLSNLRPDIVHLSGHFLSDGSLILADDIGASHRVSHGVLIDVFRALRDNIQLVALSGCHTAALARELGEFVDCAIGAEGELDDHAAVSFAAAFYGALGWGSAVERAFEVATLTLSATHIEQARQFCLVKRPDAGPVITPTETARPATMRKKLSRIALQLDRTAQWLTLKDLCANSNRPIAFLVHGDAGQDVNLFAIRVQRYLNNQCTRMHRVWRLPFEGEYSTARTIEDWVDRLRDASPYGECDTVELLRHATQHEPLMLILGRSPLRGLDGAQTRALAGFLAERLPALIARAPCANPVRVLVPIEHDGHADGLDDPLVQAAYQAMHRASGFQTELLIDLNMPTWSEVKTHLIKEIGQLDTAFLKRCQRVYERITAGSKGGFAELADTLNELLEARAAEE